MSAYTNDCPPLDICGPCGTLPPGFVRLRYFFGKRLGVADLVDEQRYHAGKMRFHTQRLHGAGVLCGLRVERFSATELMLRVLKGAAIDSCGREIVLGYDQCLDLAAWFERVRAEKQETTPGWPLATDVDADNRLHLCVALRYRECPASPEPAPRDPCSCDASGCDFGRVREEFDLEVLLESEADDFLATPLHPDRATLDRLLGGAESGGSLATALRDAAQAACPDPGPDGWLILACFAAVLDPPREKIIDVEDLHSEATILQETAVLQELLARELGAQLEAGALASSPEIVRLQLVEDSGTAGRFHLEMPLSGEVIGGTVPAAAFTLRRLDPTGTPAWVTQSATTAYVAPTATTPAMLRVTLDNGAAPGFLRHDGLYRLAIDPAAVPAATPIVDAELRPLHPLHPSFHFGVEEDAAGDLLLRPAPYAR